MWGTAGLEGRWMALDSLRNEIDGPLVFRLLVNPLVPDDSVAAVGHGGSTMAALVGGGVPSTAVLQSRAVAYSGPRVRVRRLLKDEYPQTSCGKAFDGYLLAGALDVEQPDFSRKSHFGKIVERAR